MTEQYKLSLTTAILININIIMGSGIFLNMISLSKPGILGPVVYIIVGILMLPLVLTLAELLRLHPGGTFYTFGSKEVSTFFGFLTGWIYFVGKLSSGSLMVHFFSSTAQSVIPILSSVNVLVLDFFVISVFAILNMLNLRAGSRIQFMFILCKMIPITFVILSGLYFFSTKHIIAANANLAEMLPAIPLVIYAFAGFESACSFSRLIKDPDKNAPKAVLISFLIVACIYFSYQFLFYTMLGPIILKAEKYYEAFPFLMKNFFNLNDLLRTRLGHFFQLAAASSALGGAYGILFSNSWNLYTLAENGHTFWPKLILKLNKFNIPIICVIAEALICGIYFMVTQGNNILLQQISSFSLTFTYFFCAIALFYASYKQVSLRTVSVLAILSSVVLLSFCVYNFFTKGALPFIVFLSIVAVGLIMYIMTKKTTREI